MIYKINFNITKISQRSYVFISKLIDDIKEGFVTTIDKDKLNTITKLLEKDNTSFTVEEIPEQETIK